MKNFLKYGLFACLTWVNAFVVADGLPFDIEYAVYMKDKGWGEWEQNGATAGKWDERLEALRIRIVNRDETNHVADCYMHYRAHVPGLGWLEWVKDGEIAGKIEDYPELQGESRRLEAVEVKLENCPGWDVSYRVHIIHNGWSEAHSGGTIAGTINSETIETSDEAKTLVAFKMVLLPEGCDETWQASVPKVQGDDQLLSVAWSEQQQRYVTAGRSVYTSLNGTDWIKTYKNGAGPFVHLSQVAWGGDRWIGVSDYRLYWSQDGIEWYDLELGFPGYYKNVYWSNGLWVVLALPGGMITSRDGINWQLQSIEIEDRYELVENGKSWILYERHPEKPYEITISDNGLDWTSYSLDMDAQKIFWDGRQWILISLEQGVFSSDDGKSWLFQSKDRPYNSAAIASNGETSISVGYNGAIYISDDSYSWTQVPPVTIGHLFDVNWNGEQWLAVGDKGAIITSEDGVNWYKKANGHPPLHYVNDVAGTLEHWIMAADSYGIYRSTDGINWQEQYQETGLYVDGVKWNGSHWLAIARQYSISGNGTILYSESKAVVLVSEDGKKWTEKYSKENEYFSKIGWDGERWVVLGKETTIILNSAATQQQEAGHIEMDEIGNLLWNGKVWVAIERSGSPIYYSSDAINWTVVSDLGPGIGNLSELTWRFHDIVWNGDMWMIVGGKNYYGRDGLVLTSKDAVSWQTHFVPDAGELQSVAYNGIRWVAVGGKNYTPRKNRIFTSEDGFSWEQQDGPDIDEPIFEVQWNGYQWLALLSNVYITSSDGISWQEHIIEGTRTSFYKLAWNGKQWLIVPWSEDYIYVKQCSIKGEFQNNCVIEAAHYDESTAMLHIDQLLLQGPFGAQQSVNDISLQSVANHIPFAFNNEYLDTPDNNLLCAEESATLNLGGQLNIPSVKYTPQSGSDKIFNDVIFQLDDVTNTFNFINASGMRK